MATFSIKVSAEQLSRLNRVAREKQVSRGAVIRWAIDAYLQSLFLPHRPIGSPNDPLIDRGASAMTESWATPEEAPIDPTP